MFLFLDYYNLSLFLGGLVALLSGAAVYFNDHRKIENKAWMLLNISTAVWSFGYFGMITSTNAHNALFANWILHAGAILIPLFYLFFVTTLTQTTNIHKGTLAALLPVALYFLYQNISPEFIRGVSAKGPFSFAPDAGSLYIYFTIYFFAVVLYAFTILKEKIKVIEKQESVKLRYVFYSSIAGFVGGGFVFFLTFNIQIPPYPLVLFTFYPLIIAYAMLKHKLFDVKIAATEILLGSVWVGLLFFTLLEENIGKQIIFGIIFVFIVIVGIMLIHLLYKDVERREKIEKLSEEKSEFMSFATHQVKRPLSAFKSAASMLLQGDYGPLSNEVRAVVQGLYQVANESVPMVQAFLDSSKLEQEGGMTYQMEQCDLREIVVQVTNEEKIVAEEKGLTIAFRTEGEGDESFIIQGDAPKLKQVFYNLVDNAIKYTERGNIVVELKKLDGKITFSVSDSGRGIPKEEMPKLFKKFSRAEGAQKINVSSNGLGLYLAAEFVKGHSGKIWAESAGAGKGATFFVELPVS